MILSVFYGAIVSAVLVLIVRLISMLITSGIGAASVFGAFGSTLTYAFVVFLTGFLAAVMVGAPLFQVLEKRKIRKAWPYFVAAGFVEIIFCLLVLGAIPDFLRAPVALSVSLAAPGFIVAALFARRMRPLWRQAEAAETPQAPTVVRLH